MNLQTMFLFFGGIVYTVREQLSPTAWCWPLAGRIALVCVFLTMCISPTAQSTRISL